MAEKWSSRLNPILTPDLIYLSPYSAPGMVLIFSHVIIPMALALLRSAPPVSPSAPALSLLLERHLCDK